ncbi:DUF3768 domain-containing protein [Patescibacteria group bacterium]|nr:MAG: DUF3768 domain-containing protein [Patescibacteria group bacterium]
MNSTSISQVELVAQLNDAARSNAVNYMATGGIMALDEVTISDIFVGVQNFTQFTEDNDPYGEHDFGSLEVQGHKVFWKIDYYDQQLQYGVEPLDPDCRRVVTIMLAEEY